MKISVIVPVYNVERYIETAIKSVIEQKVFGTFIEMVLINDGSKDRSGEICKMYASQYENIIYIEQTNRGIAETRNIGISKATGDYILLLDSDDFLEENILDDLINYIEVKKFPDLIIQNFNYFIDEKNQKVIHKDGFELNNKLHLNGIEFLKKVLSQDPLFSWYPWRLVVKRELLYNENIQFLKGRNYEDMVWSPLCYLSADRVEYYQKPVINYRVGRPGQITKTINYKNLADPIYIINYMEEHLNQYTIDSVLKTRLLKNIANKYFIIPIYANRLKRNERNELLMLMKKNNHLEKYSYTTVSKIILIMIKLLGYNATADILSVLVKIRKIKGVVK